MEEVIKDCVGRLLAGEILLYPTDTVWGIGCDATNEKAIERIYNLKQRSERKSMLVLLDREEKLPYYVSEIPLIAWEMLRTAEKYHGTVSARQNGRIFSLEVLLLKPILPNSM